MGGVGATSGYASQYNFLKTAIEQQTEPVAYPQDSTPNPSKLTSGQGSQYSSNKQIAGGYGSQYDTEVAAPLDPVNNPEDRQTLAERHAPILVLPEGSNDNLPASAQDFIDNSRLREDVSWWRDNQHGDNTNSADDDNFGGSDLANAPDNYFLDLDNDQRFELGRGQNDPAPLHYELDTENSPPTLTYFVFYAYNDGPSVQNHEGDWERITLELDPVTFEPTTARLSAHEHRTDVPVADIADPLTGRPVIYVAAGSHAAFPEAGVYDTEVEIFKDRTVENAEGLPIRELEGAVIYDEWGGIQDVTQQDWYPQGGNSGVRWGEIGEHGSTSGPHGPSSEKGIVDNPVWETDVDGFWGRLADTDVVQGTADKVGNAVETGNDVGGSIYAVTRDEVQRRYGALWDVVSGD